MRATRRATLLLALALGFPGDAPAGPKGGVVAAGDARIATRGARTTITQGSDKVVIDWRSFDIDAGEAVKFLQPGKGSIALNRVLDVLPTNIRGQLLANGSVWIVNRNGVTFHAGAMADVGGLLATTADISNADFMAGDYRFDRPGAPDAKIVNEGEITFAEGGVAAFVAPGAENRGVIAGKVGKVVIAGAETFAVDLAGDGFYAFALEDGAGRAGNTGRIHNPGGYVLITATSASGLVDSQISVGGVVEAQTAEKRGGRIVLSGDGGVEVSGVLDATGAARRAAGGAVEVAGDRVRVAESASIDVTGAAGGGAVGVDGARVLVAKGATILANGSDVGDGGAITVWSREATAFSGRVEARGGAGGGDGGFVEISSAGLLRFDGAADLSAPKGARGELLLDPVNIVIGAAGADDAELDDNEILFGDLDGEIADLTLSAAALSAATADVTLQATNDITVDAAVSTGFGLSLEAGRDIVLNADIAAAALTLRADADFTVTGGPAADGAGTIRFNGGGLSGADVALFAGEALTLGRIAATGEFAVATAAGGIAQGAGTALSIGGASVIDAPGQAVTLDAAGNDFGGAVALNAGGVALVDMNEVNIGVSDVASLDVGAGGAIGQSGALTVAGNAAFAATDGAGNFDITLALANDFGGRVDAAGAAVTLNDISALRLGAISALTLDVAASGALTDTAGAAISVAGAASFAATGGGVFDLTLDNDDSSDRHGFGGALSAAGRDVTLIGAGGIQLGSVSTVASGGGGSLLVGARAGSITDGDAGALRVEGDAAFEATGAILLDNAGHDFDSDGADDGADDGAPGRDFVTFLAGGAATIVDSSGLFVFDSAAMGDLTLTAATGDLSLAEVTGAALVGTAEGGISAVDISASGATFGGAGSVAGAAVAGAGAVALERAIIGPGGLGAASAREVALNDVFADGAITVRAPVQRYVYLRSAGLAAGTPGDFNEGIAGAAGDIDLLTLDRMRFGGDIAIAAGEVRFGFLDAGGDLTLNAVAGDAAKFTDAEIDYTGAGMSGTTIALGRSAATMQAADANGAFTELVSIAGDASLSATGAIVLTRGFDADGGAFQAHIDGALALTGASAAVEDSRGLMLGDLDVAGDLALRFNADESAGAGEALSQIAGGAVRVGGTLSAIAGVHGGPLDTAELGDIILDNAANAFSDVKLIGRDARLRDADGFAVTGGALGGDLRIGAPEAAQAGDLVIAELSAGGMLGFSATGAVALDRLSLGGAGPFALDGAADGGVAATDIQAAGGARLASARGAISVARFDLGDFDIVSGGALALSEGDLGAGRAIAGAGAALSNVSLATGAIEASGTLSADAVRAAGELDLTGVDVRIGALDIGGALGATATSGAIALATARTNAPADVEIAGPGAPELGIGTVGAGDLRVNDNIDAGAGTSISRDDFDRRVEVVGPATLFATGDIMLPREGAGLDGLHNRFVGAVALNAGGDATLATVDALTLAAGAVGGALTVLTNSDNAGAANGLGQGGALAVGGALSISTGDHGGAPIASAGRLGDVALTDAGNRFGGAVSVVADDAALVAAEGFALRDSRLGGALSARVASNSTSAGLSVTDMAAGGPVTLNTAGAVDLARLAVGGSLTAESRGARLDARDISAGATALRAAGAVALDDMTLGATEIAAGGAVSATDIRAGTVKIDAARATLSRAVTGATALKVAGVANVDRLIADATVIESEGARVTNARIAGALTLDAGGGAATLRDLSVSGAARIEAASIGFGGDAGARVHVGGRMTALADGGIDLSDLSVGGATRMVADGRATLDDFDIGDLTLTVGASADLGDGRLGALVLRAGGAAALDNLRLGRLDARAATGMRLDGLSAGGAATLFSAGGDIGLGAVAVAGRLRASAPEGDIFTLDSDFALGRVAIDGPGEARVPEAVAEGPDADAPLPLRVAPAGQTIVLGAERTAGLLHVAGDTYLSAGGDVALVDDVRGVTGDNDFGGGVSVLAARNVMLNDANDIALGAPTGVALPGGGRATRSGIFAAGSLRVEAGGKISDAAPPRARLEIGADALFLAGEDIRLNNGGHAIAGAVGAQGRDVILTEAGSIDLGPIRAGRDLRIVAGAAGATGDAAIRQVGVVDVVDMAAAAPSALAAAPGAAAARRRGAIRVSGDADFSTGLDPARGFGIVAAGAERDLVLGNAGNIFNGVISLRRIAGDAVLTEESAARSAGGVATAQRLANWEVGGSTLLTTTDDVVFLGRLTALEDGAGPPPRLARPNAAAPRQQGEAALPENLLRLYLNSGEEFRIDTTGGGFAPRGGFVRFDRPVDGLNDAPPVGSAAIATERGGLGSLSIAAGRGAVRFRDFVGAANPIGALDIKGGAFFAGFTFAERTPGGNAVRTRFLFDPAFPDDYFFSGPIRINVSGPLLAAPPPGQVDAFVSSDSYFGINTPAFTFGDLIAPSSAEAYGFIVNTRQRAGGLFPVPPSRSREFQFNDCVIGDVADCTNVPTPNVVNQVLIVAPPVLDIDDQELLELFGSFGNEELWGVPQSFFSDFVNTAAPCEEGSTC